VFTSCHARKMIHVESFGYTEHFPFRNSLLISVHMVPLPTRKITAYSQFYILPKDRLAPIIWRWNKKKLICDSKNLLVSCHRIGIGIQLRIL
jgi:hypothetical protein